MTSVAREECSNSRSKWRAAAEGLQPGRSGSSSSQAGLPCGGTPRDLARSSKSESAVTLVNPLAPAWRRHRLPENRPSPGRGKSRRISSSVISEASISNTSHAVIRSPRMQGCPERWPGTMVIRERSALSAVAMNNIIPIPKRRIALGLRLKQRIVQWQHPDQAARKRRGDARHIRRRTRLQTLPRASRRGPTTALLR